MGLRSGKRVRAVSTSDCPYGQLSILDAQGQPDPGRVRVADLRLQLSEMLSSQRSKTLRENIR